MELKIWWLGAYEDGDGNYRSIAIIRPSGTLGRIELDIKIRTSIVSMTNGEIWYQEDLGTNIMFNPKHLPSKIEELGKHGYRAITEEEHEEKYSLSKLRDLINDFESAYLIMKLQYV